MTKILLVEDDKSLREIYGVRLLAEGYDIVSAGDGEEALAMAIKERPNLIVSDVMMPKISGFDMLDILRSTTETRGIKVIMMTALSSEDQRRRGEALGADRYLVKSQVGIEDVVRTVHEVLGDGHLSPEQRTADKSEPVGEGHLDQNAPQADRFIPNMEAPRAQPQFAQPRNNPVQQQTVPPGPTQQYAESSMPKPIAPFSTDRPQSLGERVIHPINNMTEKDKEEENLANEVNNILNGAPQQIAQPQPQTTQFIGQPQLHSVPEDRAVQQPQPVAAPQIPAEQTRAQPQPTQQINIQPVQQTTPQQQPVFQPQPVVRPPQMPASEQPQAQQQAPGQMFGPQ